MFYDVLQFREAYFECHGHLEDTMGGSYKLFCLGRMYLYIIEFKLRKFTPICL